MGSLGQTAGHARFIVKSNGYGSVKIRRSERKFFINRRSGKLYSVNLAS